MREYLLHIAIIFSILSFGACNNYLPNEDNELPPPSGNTLSITADIPDEGPTTRVNLTEDGQNIKLTWKIGDVIQFAVKQDQTTLKANDYTLVEEDITNGGKTVKFTVNIPTGISISAPYTLHCVHGGGGIAVSGTNVNAVLPKRSYMATPAVTLPNVEDMNDVMLYFSTEIQPANPNTKVTFKHLGSIFAIHLKNSGGNRTNIKGLELVGVSSTDVNTVTNTHFAYNSFYPAYGNLSANTYNLETGVFSNNAPGTTTSDNYLHFKAENTFSLISNTTRVFWAWYPIRPNLEWPALRLDIKTGQNEDGTTVRGTNSRPAKTPVAGKTYHFWAEYGSALSFVPPFTDTPIPPSEIPQFVDLFNLSMHEDGSSGGHFRIPVLITAPNGDLVAVVDERGKNDGGDLRTNDDINILIRRSKDNGKTWLPTQRVVDYPIGQSASDASMIVDKVTNEIFLFYNYMNLDINNKAYYLYVMKSADNGKTWNTPKDITSQISKAAWGVNDFKFITSGRGIQTRTGKLLHTLVRVGKGVHLFGSDDHGETWFLKDTQISPADESKVVELTDGTWMVNSKVTGQWFNSARYVHTSTSKGDSWTSRKETQLIDPANNASIIRYTDTKDGYDKNRLLFSNTKSSSNRENMTVRISYDEGKTWSEGKTIHAGMSGYSSMTILENGDIGIFIERDHDKTNDKISFMSFSLEWLTDGKDKYKPPSK